MVGGESGRRQSVDLRQSRKLSVERTVVLFADGITKGITRMTSGIISRCERRLIDIQNLQLMNAAVPNIANLEHDPRVQFLLDVEIPQDSVRCFQIVLNARDVERGHWRAGAETRNADSKRNRGGRRDGEAAGWADGILCQSFLEVGEWNRVVVNAEAGTNDGLTPGKERKRWRPRQ